MAEEPQSQLKKLRAEAQVLLDDHQIAVAGEAGLHPFKAFLHFWVLVGRSFLRNRCPVRASALAYTTLLALIPLLAVGLGVSTSLLKSGEEQTEKLLIRMMDELAPQFENLPGSAAEKERKKIELVQTIQSFIKNIHSGALGLTGTVALVFVAIGLLSTIEATFNDIWGVRRGRNWFLRVVNYWAAITLGPLVVILVMGAVIGSKIDESSPGKLPSGKGTNVTSTASTSAPGQKPEFDQRVRQTLETVRGTSAGRFLLRFVPFFVLTGSFMLLYQMMPNTKVDWRAALVGGAVAAVLWITNGNFNALFASKVVSASRIYGSLGAIPIFLLGMYLSWTILLFGAQVAYAFQNRRAYVQEKQAEIVSQRGREFIALRIMTLVGQRHHRGEQPPTAIEIAESLGVSSRLVSQVIEPLLRRKLLLEVAVPAAAYAPARPLPTITFQDIIQAIRVGHGLDPGTRDDAARVRVREGFESIQGAEREVAARVSLEGVVRDLERA